MNGRIHGRGGRMAPATLLAGILLLAGTVGLAGELLPFPETRSLQQPVREASYLAKYRKMILALQCNELQALRDGLQGKMRGASDRDRRYYMSLVHVVDDVRDRKQCP